MKEKVKKDILDILNRVIEIVKAKKDGGAVELKELSNHTIHNASVFQDEYSVQIAVAIYALSKIIYREEKEIPKKMLSAIINMRNYLKNDQFAEYGAAIKNLFKEISKIDSKLELYIEEVLAQSAIKKGSRIYEHGISMAQAADILGISQWELMGYVGKTMIADKSYGKRDAITRLKFARSLFR